MLSYIYTYLGQSFGWTIKIAASIINIIRTCLLHKKGGNPNHIMVCVYRMTLVQWHVQQPCQISSRFIALTASSLSLSLVLSLSLCIFISSALFLVVSRSSY